MGKKEEIISPILAWVLEIILIFPTSTLGGFKILRELEALELTLKLLEDKNMLVAIEWAEKVADVIKKYRDQAVIVWG